MSHIITLRQNYYNTCDNLNYRNYRYKYDVMRLDLPVKLAEFRLTNGMLSKQELTPNLMLWYIDCFGAWCLEYFLNMLSEDEIPDSVKIAAINKSSESGVLSILKNPSTDVINAALKHAGQAIEFVSHPTTKQKLLAICNSMESPDLIQKIEKPTIQMQKIHVMRYLDGIKYINKPCETVKMAAANAHGVEVLKHIQNPSEQVLLAAIKGSPLFTDTDNYLRYIKCPNHKIMCAIKHQININKQVRAQWNSKPIITTKEQLDWLIGACIRVGLVQETIKIKNKYHQNEQAQLKALNELYKQAQHNYLMDLLGNSTKQY